VQIIGASCNVTTVQTTDVGRSKQGPRACSSGEIFPGKACTVMPGALAITVAPGANGKGLVKTADEPDLQAALSQLGLGGLKARVPSLLHCPSLLEHKALQHRFSKMCPLISTRRYTQDLGSLSVDVLFGDYVHTSKLAVLPNLEKITGVPSADAAVTGLGQPTMSQLKVNGGLGSASQNSFASVSFKPTAVNGLLQVCSHCCLYAMLLCLGCFIPEERSDARQPHVDHSCSF